MATAPTAARAAGDPEFLPEPPDARRAARGPRVSPLWGSSPHARQVRGASASAQVRARGSSEPQWGGGGGHGLLEVIATRRPACTGARPTPAADGLCKHSFPDGGAPASGPRGGVFWKMTDREPMGWAGSKASPNDQQASAGQQAEPGTGWRGRRPADARTSLRPVTGLSLEGSPGRHPGVQHCPSLPF